jgi:hypothetical protein
MLAILRRFRTPRNIAAGFDPDVETPRVSSERATTEDREARRARSKTSATRTAGREADSPSDRNRTAQPASRRTEAEASIGLGPTTTSGVGSGSRLPPRFVAPRSVAGSVVECP